jgi:hypothetical protein
MQPRYICTLKIGYCSLNCGWKGIRFNFASYIIVYVTHKSGGGGLECLQRQLALHFTVCLLTNSSSDVNTTAKWWCILPNRTCIFGSLGENDGLHSILITKSFLKTRFSCPWHSVSYSLHKIAHILVWQIILPWDHKTIPSDNFLFTVDSIFLSRNILEVYNKKRNCPLPLGTVLTLQHTLQPSLYLCHRKQRRKNKNITLKTLHSVSLQANKTSVMMVANNLWQI